MRHILALCRHYCYAAMEGFDDASNLVEVVVHRAAFDGGELGGSSAYHVGGLLDGESVVLAQLLNAAAEVDKDLFGVVFLGGYSIFLFVSVLSIVIFPFGGPIFQTLFPEEFRVSTQSHQLYDIGFVINPNQKEITFDMTFQTTLVVAYKRMWKVFFGYRLLVNQQVQKNIQLRKQFSLMLVPLQVFFVLGGGL